MSRSIETVPQLLPRLRVLLGEEIALGPGKLELLGLIHETGSIRHAAERMGMSYMRAWKLIQTMNACFRSPLVEASRGGREQGGATLSVMGLRVLELYREMEERSRKACQEPWCELSELMVSAIQPRSPGTRALKSKASNG